MSTERRPKLAPVWGNGGWLSSKTVATASAQATAIKVTSVRESVVAGRVSVGGASVVCKRVAFRRWAFTGDIKGRKERRKIIQKDFLHKLNYYDLTQLRSLIAVAEAGSVTAAAETIGVTQSGLSQALAALEESLGVKLLTRQRYGVELTAFGEQALEHARAAPRPYRGDPARRRGGGRRRQRSCSDCGVSERLQRRSCRRSCAASARFIPRSSSLRWKPTTEKSRHGSTPDRSTSAWCSIRRR